MRPTRGRSCRPRRCTTTARRATRSPRRCRGPPGRSTRPRSGRRHRRSRVGRSVRPRGLAPRSRPSTPGRRRPCRLPCDRARRRGSRAPDRARRPRGARAARRAGSRPAAGSRRARWCARGGAGRLGSAWSPTSRCEGYFRRPPPSRSWLVRRAGGRRRARRFKCGRPRQARRTAPVRSQVRRARRALLRVELAIRGQVATQSGHAERVFPGTRRRRSAERREHVAQR